MAYLGFVPPGVVLPFAGATAPQGWLLCDGTSTAISRTVYKALFDVIGTTYGVGDGSTTFNLPDMRGVFPRGAGTNGTGNYGGITGHTPAGGSLGAKGGQKTAKNGLSVTNNASTGMSANTTHGHGITDPGHGHSFNTQVVTSPTGSSGVASGVNYTIGNAASIIGSTTGITVNMSANLDHTHTSNVVLNTGDSETAPASLALNYIIKI